MGKQQTNTRISVSSDIVRSDEKRYVGNYVSENIRQCSKNRRRIYRNNFNTLCLRIFLQIIFNTLLAVVLVKGHNQGTENEPEFLAQLDNLTVTQGRDVSFTCVVNNLGQYRVAWIKSDSKAILGIHTHMVSLNPRLSVTHNGHNTWKLHISHVQLNDSGSYMCQVNTDPMKSISGYLDVVVPPDILNQPDANSAMLEEGVSNEGGIIQLVCSATGVPQPNVQWRREGGKDIILRSDTREKQIVKFVEGERLVLNNIHRTDMGGYLCIASNGIPPTVSKRFDVHVNFPPLIKAVNQLVGAPLESQVTLECIAEVFPKPLNGWYKNEGSLKLHEGQKYSISEEMLNSYTWQMNLTIRNLQSSDFGTYTCSSINALGKSEARIRLRELRLPPKSTTTPTPFIHTTSKPRRKQILNHNKQMNEVVRPKETAITNHVQENDLIGNIPEAHTQQPAKANYEKARPNAQTPAVVPSPQSPWVFSNTGSHFHRKYYNLSTIPSFFLPLYLLSLYFNYIIFGINIISTNTTWNEIIVRT